MSEELRDEQQFLLSSLRDLEKERSAGDIDDNDYAALREGYIARAAAITREIDGARVEKAVEPRRWAQRLVVSLVVLSLGVGAGLGVARSSGQRLPGDSATGGIEQSTATMLANARQLNFSDPSKAIEIYSEVLKLEPDNPEALTYRAVTDLLRAQAVDPEYPDAHCFLGIVYFRFLDNAGLAQKQLQVCQVQNPPKEVKAFVEAIVKEVDAAVKRGE